MRERIVPTVAVAVAAAVVFAVMIMKKNQTPGSSAGSSLETAGTERKSTVAAGKASGTRIETEAASVIERAGAAGKYAFIFFYSDESERTDSVRVALTEAMGQISGRAVSLEIDMRNRAELPLIDRYNVRGAPMPLILAVAPNGAITGGFPPGFEEKQLLDAFASPGEEKSLKALQDRRLVLVSIQNGRTSSNDAAMKGVRDFKADPNYGPSTELVTIDPSDPAETGFLRALQVTPETAEAVTVCLVPPGRAIARFSGGTEKEAIVSALSTGGGCGPNGCGPGGCGQ